MIFLNIYQFKNIHLTQQYVALHDIVTFVIQSYKDSSSSFELAGFKLIDIKSIEFQEEKKKQVVLMEGTIIFKLKLYGFCMYYPWNIFIK